MKRFLLLLFITLSCAGIYAEPNNICADSTSLLKTDTLQAEKHQYTSRQKWVIGGLAAQQLASYYLEYKWWWEGDFHKFNLQDDGGFNNYSLGIDKVGHFYTSYMYSNLLYELMTWGDFKESTREWVSVLMPLAWALTIEIGDGFTTQYGFSTKDLMANTLGVGYAFAQRKVPYLGNFKFKFSYFPGKYYRENNYKGWSLTADYDGHIYWLSTNVHGVLPKTAKKYWPKYLNLAFGYGVNNFSESFYYAGQGYTMQREFFIGLDYNLQALPARNSTWKAARNMIDYYHFPAPGIKKTGNENWQFKALLLN